MRISPFDHGLLTGDGVFESIVTERASRSRSPATSCACATRRPGWASTCRATTSCATASPPSWRPTGWPGACRAAPHHRHRRRGPAGSGRGTSSPLVLVTATPVVEVPDATDVVTVPWTRNEHGAVAGLKTTSYAENVVALARAQKRARRRRSSPTRRGTSARARAPTSSASSTASCHAPALVGLPGRRDPGARPGAHGGRRARPPLRRAGRGRRGLPHLDDPRRPGHLDDRRPPPRRPAGAATERAGALLADSGRPATSTRDLPAGLQRSRR